MRKNAEVKVKLPFAAAALLAVFAAFVWSAAFALEPSGNLRVSFLDVGQGDAIFIESPAKVQVLVDGGPSRAVLRELSGVLPWFDRSIDIVLATHPDKDHIGGLPEVLERYKVAYFVRSGVEDGGADKRALDEAVAGEREAREIVARAGDVFDLGGGAFLEILFPDRDVSGLEANSGSVIVRVVYGETAVILSGDAPKAIEEYIAGRYGGALQSDILKVGHHGSKTSSSELFVGLVSPEFAVFSRGCSNRYGHPHAEVLDTFARFEISVLDTCEEGTITFTSDGQEIRRK